LLIDFLTKLSSLWGTPYILAVAHQQYSFLEEEYFQSITNEKAIFIDVKGIYRNKIKNLLIGVCSVYIS
jgi:hypothetical protein